MTMEARGGRCQSVCLPSKLSVGIGRGKIGKKEQTQTGGSSTSLMEVWSALGEVQMIRKFSNYCDSSVFGFNIK